MYCLCKKRTAYKTFTSRSFLIMQISYFLTYYSQAIASCVNRANA